MTKVTVLGGSGDMGRYVVRALAADPAFSNVTVADIDARGAGAFAAECGPGVSARHVDVSDGRSLDDALSGTDAVVSCVGPFFRFGLPVLRSAIRNRVDYLDICDDWEPTLEMLDLDVEAEEAGIVALVGMGASPGVSNLLAVKAAESLDSVTRIVTAWGVGGGATATETHREEPSAEEPSAAVVHWFHQLTGTIRVVESGSMVDRAPLDALTLDVPGFGVGRGWTVGHPEAVTLPRRWPEVEECVNAMVGSPVTIGAVGALAELVDDGQMDVREAAHRLTSGQIPKFVVDSSPLDDVRLPPLFATVEGTRDGQLVRRAAVVLALPPSGMGGSTGIPAAVGLRCLLADRPSPGVHTPEEVIDPDRFFAALASLCEPPRAEDDMVVVSEDDSARGGNSG